MSGAPNGAPGEEPGGGEHTPVLRERALEALAIRADGCYVDATFGRGGHAGEILGRLGEEGKLIAFDRDPEAGTAASRLFGNDSRARFICAPFSKLSQHVARRSVDGILFDLGVSSPQLEAAARGFSFLRDGPLDMRMDPQSGESAAGWLALADEREISLVISRFGEERHARRIARAIVAARAIEPVTTTGRLAGIIAAAVPGREPGRHPATRSFQALRIHVNDELGEIERVLPQAVDALAVRGRIAVISFHSLEDRIVKRYLRSASREDPAWAGMPQLPPEAMPRLKLVGRATFADESEIARNPRARSAVLRVAEKVAA